MRDNVLVDSLFVAGFFAFEGCVVGIYVLYFPSIGTLRKQVYVPFFATRDGDPEIPAQKTTVGDIKAPSAQ
jgi:hypothetical protein